MNTRRDFLGIVVLLLSPAPEAVAQRGGQPAPKEISAWLHIGEDGVITVYTGKTEVGQNIRTSLAQAVAEELGVPMDSIQLVMADTDRTPYDAGTFGSRTTPDMSPRLRRAAAAAREILLNEAAKHFGVERSALTLQQGAVVSGAKSVRFAELTKGKKLLDSVSADDSALKSPQSWTIAGTTVRKVNGRSFVTGAHEYTSDMKLPGMVYGKVLRPPMHAAQLASAEGPGLIRDGGFAGVVGPDPLSAAEALKAIKADWKSDPQPNSTEIYDYFRKNAGQTSNVHAEGTIGELPFKQTYTVAYIAHAPLEPRAAVAHWEGDKLTVWTGTQRPFGVREELSRVFAIPATRIRVIVPDTGSGYGGKHSGEAAIEAARLAKAAGRPVKLVWTREEEFNFAYFRPAGVIDVAAAVDKGRITGWQFRNFNSGGSAIRTPYDIPNQQIEFVQAKSPLRQGSYRALAATANTFARESAMDELAASAGVDPLEFRLQHLKAGRLRDVLEAAAKQFAWKNAKGTGIACGTEKGGYVASAAQVVMKGGVPVVQRIVTAFECGPVINPDHLKHQVEGGVLMALGGALFENVQFADGRILNGKFSKYRVPRFGDMPLVIDTVLVNRKDLPPSGAGECPLIALAPAIAQAIYSASGRRVRSMPLAADLEPQNRTQLQDSLALR